MFGKLKRYFLSGLVVFLPLTLTIYLFLWSLNFADGLLGKYIEPLFAVKFGFYFRGISILISVYFIILIGFFASNFFGRRLYETFERTIIKLPFFRQVYPAIKEMAIFLFSRDKLAFKQVALVEYPRKGVYVFGFLTNEHASEKICKQTKEDLCNVFIPSAPSPITGFVTMIPRKEVILSDISVEEAIKFNVSGGVVNPYAL